MSTPKLRALNSLGGSLFGIPKVSGLLNRSGSSIGSPKLLSLQSSAYTLLDSPKILSIAAAAIEVGGNRNYLYAGFADFVVMEPVVYGDIEFNVVELAVTVDFVVIETVVIFCGQIEFCVVPPPELRTLSSAGLINLAPVINAIGSSGYIPLYASFIYAVDFNVVNTSQTSAASVEFNVLGSNYRLFPVSFAVEEIVTHNYPVSFNVCLGFVEYSIIKENTNYIGDIYFNVIEPPARWLVNFSVIKSVSRLFGVNYYVSQTMIPDSISVSCIIGNGIASASVHKYYISIEQNGILTATKAINILKRTDARITFILTNLRQIFSGADIRLRIYKNGTSVYDQLLPFSSALEVLTS